MGPPPNKAAEADPALLQFHRPLLPSGHETRRFEPPGHRAGQLSREPLGGVPRTLRILLFFSVGHSDGSAPRTAIRGRRQRWFLSKRSPSDPLGRIPSRVPVPPARAGASVVPAATATFKTPFLELVPSFSRGRPLTKRLKLTRPCWSSTALCYLLATKPGGSSYPVIGPGSLAASR